MVSHFKEKMVKNFTTSSVNNYSNFSVTYHARKKMVKFVIFTGKKQKYFLKCSIYPYSYFYGTN